MNPPEWLSVPVNQEVAAFIAANWNLSAHSDVGSELLRATKDLPGAEAYSPSYAQCRYVVVQRGGAIFAMAYGMHEFAVRVPADQQPAARHDGLVPDVKLGSGWLVFNPFRVELTLQQSRAIAERWCRAGYDYAATLKD